MTLYLVRHADAGSRSAWDGYLHNRFTGVVSCPWVGCLLTAAPLAHAHGLEVQICDPLDEGSPPDEGLALLRSLAGTEALLCSHGDVIPAVVRALIDSGLPLEGDIASVAKAGTFEIDSDGTALTALRYIPPPPLP